LILGKDIRAVSFDGDNTLWDFDRVMRHSLLCVLEELENLDHSAASQLTIEKMISIRDKVAERKGGTTNLEQIRLEAFRQTLREVGTPDDALAGKLNRIYLKHRFEDIELFPDVIPALSELKSGRILGLLSNGNSYPEKCGLEDFFSFVVFSQDHGFEKPDTRLFQVALRKAGCREKEIIHIGDSLETDILGANQAGIKSVWLNRRGEENQTHIVPDYEIRSLTELNNS
jgi:putative hydrolase of the HAD superfamily